MTTQADLAARVEKLMWDVTHLGLLTKTIPVDVLDDDLKKVITSKTSAGGVIHDFVNSTNPKFKGKSKAERIRMALGAYYGMKS